MSKNTVKKIRIAVPSGKVTSRDGTEHECTHLDCEVYYSLGGYSCWSYKQEGRGYYMSVSPVRVDGMFISYTAFSGVKQLIVPCERKGKGKAAEAVKIFDSKIAEMVDMVFPNSGVDFTKEEAA